MDCLPFPDYLTLISLSQRTSIVNKQKQISSFIETLILLRYIVMAIYRFFIADSTSALQVKSIAIWNEQSPF